MEDKILNENETVVNTVPQTNEIKKIEISQNDLNKFENSSAYRVTLENFEGPLDLLLYLIKDSKVEITEVKLANITEQYLSYMEDLENVDMEKAAEFIEVAATLLEIKSKSLIPTEREVEVDTIDPEKQLLLKLKEYKMIKEESEKLKLLENVNRFYKKPDNSVGEFKYELPDKLSVDALVKAFTDIMQKMTIKAEVVQEKKIEKERFTVAQKISQIKDWLITKEKFRFSELFDGSHSRNEVINTFLALLELLKRQYITVCQNELFSDIDIVRNEDESARLQEEPASEFDGEE